MAVAPKESNMKIITYNLLNGGGGNQHWSHVIEAFDPDIFLAQESYPPEKCGLQQDLRGQAVWRPANKYWGTAVYAKCGKVTELKIENLGKFQGWLVGAELDGFSHPGIAGRRLRVFSLHAPPWSITGDAYPETVKKMLNVIWENREDADMIIGGDFNLYSLGERHKSEIKNGKPWITLPEERGILTRLRDTFGLTNCWQTANPGVPLAQTLRWCRNPISAFHCDGIFVPESWKAKISCTVINNEVWTDRRRPRSDHNPVLATIADVA
jgi:exonuclease III